MSTINVCMCGTQDGYPHHPCCPWPLYRGTDRLMAEWEKAYLNKEAGLIALSPLPDDRQSSIDGGIAPQHPVDDFFDVR